MDEQKLFHRRIVELDEELFLARLKELEVDVDDTLPDKAKARQEARKNVTSCEKRLEALKAKRRELGE